MEQEFQQFQQFESLGSAKPLIKWLNDNEFPYKLIDYNTGGEIYTGSPHIFNCEVQVKTVDIEKINELLLVDSDTNEVLESHYLNSFSNDELIDILKNYDKWNADDYELAQEILKDRGNTISQSELADYKKQRLLLSQKPKKINAIVITLAYIFSLLAPFLTLLIGLAYWKITKRDLNGEKFHVYDKPSRTHGAIIFTISLVISVVIYFVQFY